MSPAFEYYDAELYMMRDHAWSEKLLLAVVGVLIMVAVVQLAMKYLQ
jgi:hypothetical protein